MERRSTQSILKEINPEYVLGGLMLKLKTPIFWPPDAKSWRASLYRKSKTDRQRLFRVPWTTRRTNYSILKEINPESTLEGLMMKLKLQYFGHLMQRADSLKKTLMLGGVGGRRRRG